MNSTVLPLANGPLVGHSTRLIARRSKPALYKAKQSKTGSDEGGTKSRRSESSRALRPALRVHSTRCRWRATYASKSHSTTVERTTYTTHSPTGIELIGREGGMLEYLLPKDLRVPQIYYSCARGTSESSSQYFTKVSLFRFLPLGSC